MTDKEEWVPYAGYEAPKQRVFWQVFDVLFVLVLCYICLFIPIVLTGKVLVG